MKSSSDTSEQSAKRQAHILLCLPLSSFFELYNVLRRNLFIFALRPRKRYSRSAEFVHTNVGATDNYRNFARSSFYGDGSRQFQLLSDRLIESPNKERALNFVVIILIQKHCSQPLAYVCNTFRKSILSSIRAVSSRPFHPSLRHSS